MCWLDLLDFSDSRSLSSTTTVPSLPSILTMASILSRAANAGRGAARRAAAATVVAASRPAQAKAYSLLARSAVAAAQTPAKVGIWLKNDSQNCN